MTYDDSNVLETSYFIRKNSNMTAKYFLNNEPSKIKVTIT